MVSEVIKPHIIGYDFQHWGTCKRGVHEGPGGAGRWRSSWWRQVAKPCSASLPKKKKIKIKKIKKTCNLQAKYACNFRPFLV